jgi:hypothetical protein
VYESYNQLRIYKMRLLCTAQSVIFVYVFRVHKLNKMTIWGATGSKNGKNANAYKLFLVKLQCDFITWNI